MPSLTQEGRVLATTQDSYRLHNYPVSLEITFRDQRLMDEPHGIAGGTELFANAWLAEELELNSSLPPRMKK